MKAWIPLKRHRQYLSGARQPGISCQSGVSLLVLAPTRIEQELWRPEISLQRLDDDHGYSEPAAATVRATHSALDTLEVLKAESTAQGSWSILKDV